MHRDAAGRASPASVLAAGSFSSGGKLKNRRKNKKNKKKSGGGEIKELFSRRGAAGERAKVGAPSGGSGGAMEGGAPRGRSPAPRGGAARPARPPWVRGLPAPHGLTSIAAGSPRESSQVIQAEQGGKGRGKSKILARRSRAVSSLPGSGRRRRLPGERGDRGAGGGRRSGRAVRRRLSVSDCGAGHQCSLLSKVHQQSQ